MLSWLKQIFSPAVPTVREQTPDPAALDLEGGHGAKRQGDEYMRVGRFADAERNYRQVIATDAGYPGALGMLGAALTAQHRTQEAQGVLERAVVVAPNDAEAHFLLGSLLAEPRPNERAILHLQKAVNLRPDFEPARHQLIGALSRATRFAEAVSACKQAIELMPRSAALQILRSELHQQANQLSAAIEAYQRALGIDAGSITAQQGLSRLLLESGQLERAEHSYRREIELTPDHFGPYHMLGVTLCGLGRHLEGIEQFKEAIRLNPSSGASYASLAAACLELDDSTEKSLSLAHDYMETAVRLQPDSAEFHHGLALNHWRRNQASQALASFDRSIAADPTSAKARWARAMIWAAPFRAQGSEIPDRSGFAGELTRFENWWTQDRAGGAEFVGELQPFYLTYQEEDNIELLSQYGRLCTTAMQRWLVQQAMPTDVRAAGRRIRIGIVSADIRLHSIWMALIKGWFQTLDRERFELVAFALSSQVDTETLWARQNSDVFVGGSRDLSHWVAAIREQNCEILLYPAVGLDPMTQRLASLRLAPVQINTWGHPDTSGSPTVDYYVSAECFEPDDAQRHYSEKLVLLPHLGNFVQPMNLSGGEADLAALGINSARPVLVCPGTPFKYQPEHDHVFIEIARRLPSAQLVFFSRPESVLGKLLQERLTRKFEAAGLPAEKHVRFIRWLTFNEFHGLLRSARVLLDTIGFSGYNTVVQAMECGLPIATREGRFLRGRLGSGVLRRMGMTELIVETEADYVDLVVRLVNDAAYAAYVREEIRLRRTALYDDRIAMTAFQRFLEAVARPSES